MSFNAKVGAESVAMLYVTAHGRAGLGVVTESAHSRALRACMLNNNFKIGATPQPAAVKKWFHRKPRLKQANPLHSKAYYLFCRWVAI